MLKQLVRSFLLAVTAIGTVQAQDVVKLKNGDQLTGTVQTVMADKVVFESSVGTVDIPTADIADLVTSKPVQIMIDGDAAPQMAMIQSLSNGSLRIGDGTGSRDVTVERLRKVPEAPAWTGSIAFGASLSRGNTERRTASATAEASRRSEIDRVNVLGSWNYAEDKDGDTGLWDITQRRLQGIAQYDRFISDKLYAYGNLAALNDEQAAIELRFQVGAGLGYQIFDGDEFELSAEGGLTYVDENYVGSVDDADYLAGRVAATINWEPLDYLSVYHNAEWIQSFDDTDDALVNLDTRARITLTESMFAQGQWIVNYDNTPATGNDETDQLFLLQAGWGF